MTLSKEQAVDLPHGTIFYHKVHRNADGTPVRCRKNGRCKTWKRDPGRWILPVKYGLRDCFYITPTNAMEWTTDEQEANRVGAT